MDPENELERIFEQMTLPPTDAQRCFVRNYVKKENVAELKYLGRRSPDEVKRAFPKQITGNYLEGSIDGRRVHFVIGDSGIGDNGLDHVYVRVTQPDGKIEEYERLRRSLENHTLTVLYQDGRILKDTQGEIRAAVGTPITRVIAGIKGFPNNRALEGPVNERHEELMSYDNCSIPIAEPKRQGPLPSV